ncbi:nucleoside hydrolase [Halosimplex amylolyticum]|uniref:nucleoside hydrolase n=1 Tax=Halosimplex amylolyticum TaxID=3396616 RepID=UPI003F552E96
MPTVSLAESQRVEALEPPEGAVDVVLDTDAYNEIDDQFAVAYALLSGSISVEAICAAPFYHSTNDRSESPEDGMEQSYQELRRLLDLLDRDAEGFVHRGATEFMDDGVGPVDSPATETLIRAAKDDRDGRLYVVAIGAPTNVASAIQSAPEIAEDIVVVWLGGHPHSWHTAREFNLMQDYAASKTLFDSGVPLVQVPCKNVAEHVRTTVPELRDHLPDEGGLGEFLFERFSDYRSDGRDLRVWSKEIWDMAPIAYLVDAGMVPTTLTHAPTLSEGLQYGHDPNRHLVRVATDADRDRIFDDFFAKLTAADLG